MKKNQKSRIPTFTSREEEAIWWETHSIADYMDEFEIVKARFAKNVSDIQHVPLDAPTYAMAQKEARTKGMGVGELVSMWIREKLAAKPSRATA